MRRITILGLCLIAVLAVSALAAGSASALEWKACIKATSGGEFSDKACSSPQAGGKYKLGSVLEGKKKTFKGKGSSPKNYLINPFEPSNAELNPGGFPKGAIDFFEASGDKSSGEFVSPEVRTFTEEFKKVKTGGKNCNSPGQGKGKIKTNLLAAKLVPLATGSGQGEVITNAAMPGGVLAEFECEGVGNIDHGAVIIELVGLSGPATKTWTVKASSRGGSPNNLQEFLKPGSAGTELEEEGAIDAMEIGACEKVPGKTEAECLVKYPPDGETFSPVTLLDKVSSPPVELPAGQNGSSLYKSEMVKVG
jgi:hypothetical protein